MKKISGIVFDWGGVIIDEPSEALQAYCAEKLQIPLQCGGPAIWAHLRFYQENRISERALWQRVCADCGQDESVIPGHSLWAEALRTVFRFRPLVLKIIAQLPVHSIKVGFLSNTEPEAAAYFHEKQMNKMFDAAVLSCEVGLSKPDKKIYQLVAARMGVSPSALLMLDDRPENISGATAAGMQGALVSQTDEILQTIAAHTGIETIVD